VLDTVAQIEDTRVTFEAVIVGRKYMVQIKGK